MGILGYWVPTSSCPRRRLSEAGCGSQGLSPDDHKLAAAEDSVSTFQVGDKASVQTLLCAVRHRAEILEASSLNQGTRCLADRCMNWWLVAPVVTLLFWPALFSLPRCLCAYYSHHHLPKSRFHVTASGWPIPQ